MGSGLHSHKRSLCLGGTIKQLESQAKAPAFSPGTEALLSYAPATGSRVGLLLLRSSLIARAW